MSTVNYKKACIFGGTGFVGRQIVRGLAHQGYIIKVATRVPERAYFLKTAGNVGQIVPYACNYADEASLREAVRGCDVVINCVGILFEKGKNTFQKIQADLPRAIAKACREEQVRRFVHLSALSAEQSSSKYGKSKRAGEAAILENFPKATILRPSVIFGVEDNFFNMFAKMTMILPFLPLIGGGKNKVQPVYVGDVADAVMAAIKMPEAEGKIYELGGPDVVTFKEVYEQIFEQTERRVPLITLPWSIAKLQGCVFSLMPKPLLTPDQVESLKTDNVVSVGSLGFKDLGIAPKDMDVILPTYLARFRPGGRFGDKKRA